MNLRRVAVLAIVSGACVLALASCGKSSNVTSADPNLDNAPPAAPSNVTSAYVAYVNYDYLYWNPSTSASVAGYEVWEAASQGGTATRVAVADAKANYVVLPSVAANATLYYEVRAKDASGNYSAFSSEVAVDRHAPVGNSSGGGSNGGGNGIGNRVGN